MHRCVHCDAVYVVSFDTSDFEHDCNTQSTAEALYNEDVPLLGSWEDYTGSGDATAQAGMQGLNLPNNRGVKAQNYQWTTRGNIKTTHRTRKHFHFNTHQEEDKIY